MAGRALLRTVNEALEAAGGEDWIFERIADGWAIGAIAAALGEDLGVEVSRAYLYTWRDEGPHRERRRAKWKLAQELSAQAHLEAGQEILDSLHRERGSQVKSAEVSLATSRAMYRKALAEMRDPSLRPQGAQVNVAVSVGDMALDALRRREVARTQGEVLEASWEPAEGPGEALPGLVD